MNKYSNCFNSVAVAILVYLIVTPVFAQQTRNDQTEAWRAIDEEFRQAIVEEISLRRGLDAC